MKKKIINKIASCLILLMIFTVAPEVQAQVDPEEVQTIYIHSRGLQRVGNTFESIWLIDNQTVLVPMKKTFEFDIQHRFGTINNGYSDLWGLYAPSNIRMGFGYTPINNLMVGFGLAKDRMLWDFNIKYSILRETGKNPSPVSVTYYGNMAIDTRGSENFNQRTDRYTYFHQMMVARKLTRDFSAQASINFSHFNSVPGFLDVEGNAVNTLENDHWSFSLLGRYKVSDAFSFIANYDQPLTPHPRNNPNPNLSFGVELATPLHAFQIFLGNYRWMVPQYNNMLNNNNFTDGAFLLGFNITRLLDVQEENLFEMMFKRKKKKNE
jgi:hypothetical protein